MRQNWPLLAEDQFKTGDQKDYFGDIIQKSKGVKLLGGNSGKDAHEYRVKSTAVADLLSLLSLLYLTSICNAGTVCPESQNNGHDPFYLVSYCIKWGKTSWTYCTVPHSTDMISQAFGALFWLFCYFFLLCPRAIDVFLPTGQ